MFELPATVASSQDDKRLVYRNLNLQLKALLDGERDWIANAANCAALLYHTLPALNWAGFYFLRASQGRAELVLGPFQGKPACTRIPVAPVHRGVCGRAAAERRSIVVENVNEFPEHIACDSASNSELVVPLIKDGEVQGVLDLDSPELARFDTDDRAGVEALVATFLAQTDAPAKL